MSQQPEYTPPITKEQAIAMLKAGKVDEWNELRRAHKKWVHPDLSGADLKGLVLKGVNLEGSSLFSSNLKGSCLRSANIQKSTLGSANLSDCDMSFADLQGTNFSFADLRKVKLLGANLKDTILFGVLYDFKQKPSPFWGIRVDGASGNARFVRFVKDRDYIMSFEQEHPKLAWWWGLLTNYGQSLLRVALIALGVALLFGFTYLALESLSPGSFDLSEMQNPIFAHFYFSIITFTTLGFGDVHPTWWLPMLLVMTEVIAGYFTLGLLISILADKVARRA